MNPDEETTDIEETTQSPGQRFSQATTTQEEKEIVSDYLVGLGFDKSTANSFLDANAATIYEEINKFGGLNDRNPFIKFILKYREINGNISELLVADNYNVIHNSVATHLFTSKQISFTADSESDPKILLNKNLYSIRPVLDMNDVVRVWADLGLYKINAYVTNKYVRYLLSDSDFTDTTSQNLITSFNNFCGSVHLDNDKAFNDLRRSVMFSSALNTAIDSIKNLNLESSGEWLNKINEIKANFKTQINSDHINFLRTKPVGVDIMQEQIDMLHKDVVEGDRTVTGQYQSSDSTQNTRYRSSSQRNSNQRTNTKDLRDTSTQREVSELKKLYNTDSNSQLIRELNAIVDALEGD